MVAIVSGNSLGLFDTSAANGLIGGDPATGRGREAVYVNGATGNLVVRSEDERLAAIGLDIALVRTYNSQGQVDGDNNDNWRIGVYRRVYALTGTVNAAGSTVTKTFGDGADVVYTYDTTLGKYVGTGGDGAHDTLAWDGSQWTWTDGSSRSTETYDGTGRLISAADADGNALTFAYSGSLVSSITDASGQVTYLDYNGANLSQIRVVFAGQTQTRTRYFYDASNRLTQVVVDLTPEIDGVPLQDADADGMYDSIGGESYVTRYTYDGTSNRIASIAQGDGSRATFTYQLVGGVYRVHTYTDGEGRLTTFDYTTVASGSAPTYNLNSAALVTPPAGGWSGASVLESAGTAADNPAIGFDQNGNGWAVWRQGSDVIARRYDAASGTWGAPITLDSNGNPVTAVSLAVDAGGNAVAVWVQSNGSGNSAYVSRYSATTGTWTAAALLESSTTAVTSVVAAVNANGRAGAVWVQGNMYGAYFDGSTWSSPTLLETSSSAVYDQLAVAIDSEGNLSPIWKQGSGIYTNRFTAGSAAWSGRIILSSGGTSFDPKIAFDAAGNGIAIWREANNVWSRRYTKSTNSWSSQFNLIPVGSISTAYATSLAVDANGDAIAAWVQDNGFGNQVYANRYDAASNTWSGAPRLSSQVVPQASGSVAVAIGNGRAVAAWVQTDGTRDDQYVARFDGAWGAPELLETNNNAAAQPAVAVDAQGSVSVLWQQSDGTANSIYANRYGNGDATPYYVVPNGATWASVATALYGASGVANELQAALGDASPTPTAGTHLTNLPATLVDADQVGSDGQTDVTDPLGRTTTYRFDTSGRLSAVLSPSVNGARLETRYAYDGAGNLTSVAEDPAGTNRVTTHAYDANGNRTLSRDSAGNTVTRVYSATNQLLNETQYLAPDPDGAGTGQPTGPLTTRYVYDAEEHLRFVVSADGRVTEHRYNSAGQRTTTLRYPGVPYPVSSLTPTDTLYLGLLTSWASSLPSDFLTKLERVDYAYDFRGQLQTTTTWTATGSTGAGTGTPTVTRFVYDQRGNLLQTIDPRGEATPGVDDYVTHFTYDGLGRLLTTTEWIGADDVGEAITRTTINQYDDAGNRTVTTILGDQPLNRAAITTPVAGWSVNPSLLETSATAATTPKMAFDQNGDGIAVWVQGNVIYYSDFSKASGQWSDPQWVSGFSTAPSALNVSMSANGNVLVVWRIPNPTNGSIFASTRVNGAWSGGSLVPTAGTGDATDPVGAINNQGQATVVYRQAASGTTLPYSLGAAQYRDGAWQFGALGPRLIESNNNTVATPASLAMDASGNVSALWLQANNSGTSIYLARFDATSNTWSTPDATLIQNGINTVSSPKIAFDANGNGMAVWIESNSLYARTYTRSTNTWSGAKLLENSTTTVIANSVGLSMSANGNALVTWRQNSAGVYARRYISGVWQNSASNADTGDWVSNNIGTTYNPVGVISDTGQVAVAFLQNVSNRVNAYVSRYTSGWNAPELVENSTIGVPTASTNGPSVALDSDGNVGVVWIQSDGTANSVYTNRYEANPQPYYAVPGSATTWDDIAQTLYGVRSLGDDLQAALGNPALGAGVRLTDLPARLTDLVQTNPANAARVTTSLYDRAGELISVTEGGPGPTNLGTTSYKYDANGNLRIVVDPTGIRRFHLYDEANRKIAEIDGDGSLSEFVYDRLNQVVEVVRYADRLPANILIAGSANSLVDAQGNPTAVTLATLKSILPTTVGRASDRIERKVYDTAGRLVYTIDPVGAVTQTIYDGAGRATDIVQYATELSLAAGVAELRPGATAGQLVDAATGTTYDIATSADDRRIRYFYDSDDLLRGTLDAEGYLGEVVYDAAGRVIQTIVYANATAINADGSVDAALRSTGTLDELRASAGTDNETAEDPERDAIGYLFYDGQGRQIGELDAENYFTETVYDLDGRVHQTIRYDRQIGYAQDSNPFQRIKNIATAPANPPTVTHVTTFVYDGLGRLVQEFDHEGTLTIHAYDVLDNLTGSASAYGTDEVRTTQARYDALGRVTQELSGDGSAALAALVNPTAADVETIWNRYGVRYAYDVAGRRISATVEAYNLETGATQIERTYFYYDNDGRLRFTVNALGEVSENRYDAFGQLTERFAYTNRISTSGLAGGLLTDALIARLTPAADSVRDARTSISYTLAGQTYIRDTGVAGGGVGTHAVFAYDAFGEEAMRFDLTSSGAGRLAVFTRDHRGLLLNTHYGQLIGFWPTDLGVEESNTYDAFGRLTATVDANGNVSGFAYDRLGRTVVTTDPLTGQHTLTYDAFNRVLTARDATGNVTEYRYTEGTASTPGSVTVVTPELIEVTTAHNRHGQTLTVTTADNVATYEYDANGQVIRVSDRLDPTLPLGTTIETRAYDSAGREVTATDARGTITRFAYDAVNRVLTRTVDDVSGGLGLQTTYEYDGQGRVTFVTDPNGQVTKTDYDSEGRVTDVVIDPIERNPAGLNLQTHYTFDLEGRTLTVTTGFNTAEARTTEYHYDVMGRRTQEIVDPGTGHLNLTTEYRYDKNGNVTRKIDARGNSTWYVYDAKDRQIYTIDALGDVTQSMYDAEDRIVGTRQYINPVDVGDFADVVTQGDVGVLLQPNAALDRFEQTVYDKNGRAAYRIDAEGAVTERAFDVNGNVTHVRLYAKRVARNIYTTVSGIRSALTSAGNSTNTLGADDRIDWNVYDARARLVYTYDGTGAVVQYVRDGNGNVITQTAYATRRATGNPIELIELTAATLDSWAATQSGNADNQTTRYWYDAADRLRFTLDAEGYLSETRYADAARDISDVRYCGPTKPAIGATATLADVVTAAAAVASSGSDQIVVSHTDAAGRVDLVTDAEGYRTQFVYDTAGNRTETHQEVDKALGRWAVTRHYFDDANREIYTRSAEGYLTEYRYNAAGFVETRIVYDQKVAVPAAGSDPTPVSGDSGHVTRYVYDANNRMTRETRELLTYNSSSSTYTVASTGVTTWEMVAGARYGSADVADELQAAMNDVPLTPGTTLTNLPATLTDVVSTEYRYDARGNRTDEIAAAGTPDAVTTHFVYDSADRLIETTNAYGSADAVTTHLTLDTFGNVQARYDAYGTADERVVRFTYDRDNRVTSELHTLSGGWAKVYDTFGNVIRVTDGSLADERYETFTYDHRNLRTTWTNGASDVTVYSYDAVGNLKRSTDGNAVPLTTTSGDIDPYYVNWRRRLGVYYRSGDAGATAANLGEGKRAADLTAADKQLLTDRCTVAYYYDRNNRMIYASDANGVLTSYVYDGAGNKTETVQNVLAAWGGTGEWTDSTYEYDLDNRLTTVIDPIGGVTRYELDVLGNQTKITDADGGVRDNVYDKLGRLRTSTLTGAGLGNGGLKTTNAYDRRGNVVAATQSYGDDSDARTTTYRYDLLNRQTRVTDGEGFSTTVTYDKRGNQTSVTAGQYLLAAGQAGYDAGKAGRATARTTNFTYDVDNRLTDTIDGANDVIHYAYDTRGNRTRVTEAYGAVDRLGVSLARTTVYTYDRADRVLTETTPMGGRTIYAYDRAGNKKSEQRLQAAAVYSYVVPAAPGGGSPTWDYIANDIYGSSTVAAALQAALTANGQPLPALTPGTILTNLPMTLDGTTTIQVTVKEYYSVPSNPNGGALTWENIAIELYGSAGVADQLRSRYGSATPSVGAKLYNLPDSLDEQTGTMPVGDPYYVVTQEDIDFVEAPWLGIAYHVYGSLDTDIVNYVRDKFGTSGYYVGQHLSGFLDPVGIIHGGAGDRPYGTFYSVQEGVLVQDTEPVFTPRDLDRTRLTNMGPATVPAQYVSRLTPTAAQWITYTYEYDGNHNLTAEIDPYNTRTEHEYDTRGNVTWHHYAVGTGDERSVGMEYDLNNRKTADIDAYGYRTIYRYDGIGNRTKVTDPLGHVVRYYYDAAGRLTTVAAPPETGVIPGSIVNAFEYDSSGNRTEERVYINRFTGALSDTVAPVPIANDAYDRIVTKVYDKSNRMVSRFDPDHVDITPSPVAKYKRTDYVYDGAGNKVQEIQYANAPYYYVVPSGVTLTWSNMASTLYGNGGTAVASSLQTALGSPTLAVGLYLTGLPPTITVSSGTTYNLRLNVVSGGPRTLAYHYDAAGRLDSFADADSTVTIYTYDAANNKTSESVINYDDPSNPTRKTIYAYDFDNRRTTEVLDPIWDFTLGVHKSSGLNLVRDTSYDLLGNVVRTAVSDPGDTNASPLQPYSYTVTRYSYDLNNRRLTEVHGTDLKVNGADVSDSHSFRADLATAANVVGDSVTTFGYDLVGNRTSVTDARQNVTTYVYDLDNRLTQEIHPAVIVYDMKDDPDYLRATTIASPTVTNVYDVAGNVVETSDASGFLTTFYYDGNGRKIGELRADNTYCAYSYTTSGELASKTEYMTPLSAADADSARTAAAGNVDAAGNVRALDVPQALLTGPTRTTFYFYDLAGRLTSTQLPGVEVETLTTTSAYAHTVTVTSSSTTGTTNLTVQAVLSVEEHAAVIAGATSLHVAYRKVGAGTSLYDSFTDTVVPFISGTTYRATLSGLSSGSYELKVYYRDINGNEVIVEYQPSVATNVAGATYTGAPLKTSYTAVQGEWHYYNEYGDEVETLDRAGKRTISYYDVKHRKVAAVDSLGYLVEWDYDAVGNQTAQRVYATPLANPNRLDPRTRPTAPGGAVDTTSRYYDAASRLIRAESPQIEVFDPDAQTSTTTMQTTQVRPTTTYAYDAMGNVREKTIGAGTSRAVTEYNFYDSMNRRILYIDADRVVTGFNYDANGNLIGEVRYYGSLPPNIDLAQLERSYDNQNPALIIAALFNRQYLAGGALKSNGLTESIDYDVDRIEATQHTYDAMNRLTSDIDLMDPGLSEDDLGKFYLYDRNGNRTWSREGQIDVTTADYDGMGRLLQTVAPDQYRSFFSYNAAGNLTHAYTGASGVNSAVTVTNSTAAFNNGVLSITSPIAVSGLQTWVVYGSASTAAESDPIGLYLSSSSVQMTAGSPVVATISSIRVGSDWQPLTAGSNLYFRVVTQDAAGNLAWSQEYRLTVPATNTATVGLTPLGQAGGRNLDGTSAGYYVEYQYDDLDRKIGSNENDGLWREFGYDANGNIVETRLYGKKGNAAPITTYTAYDERGRKIADLGATVVNPDSTTVSYGIGSGTTYQSLAVQQYGNASLWYVIANANYDLLPPDSTWTGAETLVSLGLSVGSSVKVPLIGTYTVAAGDTYQSIALQRYGDAALWFMLEEANLAPWAGGTVGYATKTGTEALTAGTVIILPTFERPVERYRYDALDHMTGKTDANGNRWAYVYNALGTVTQETDPNNGTRRTFVDQFGHVTASVTPSDNATLKFYDAQGRLIRERVPTDSTSSNVVEHIPVDFGHYMETDYAYDLFGRLVAKTDGRGVDTGSGASNTLNVTSSNTGASGTTNLVVDMVMPGEWGLIAAGSVVLRYRLLGSNGVYSTANMTPVGGNTMRATLSGLPVGTYELRVSYSKVGYGLGFEVLAQAQTVATSAATSSFSGVSNTLGDYTTTYEYDQRGRLTKVIAAEGWHLANDNSDEYKDKRESMGFARELTSVSSSQKQQLLDRYTTSYGYDSHNNRTTTTTYTGITNDIYDSMNRIRRSVYTPRNDGGPTSGGGSPRTTWYDYDAYGNLIQETDAENRVKTRSYYAFGRLKEESDGDGTIRYEYDDFGRLVHEYDPSGIVRPAGYKDIVRRYDAAGRLIAVEDRNPQDLVRTNYTYTITGQRRREIVFGRWADSTSGVFPVRRVEYEYDKLGQMVRWKDRIGGQNESIAYDADGNRRQVYSDLIPASFDPPTPASRVVNHVYDFDFAGRVISQADRPVSGSDVATSFFTYDAAGNRKTWNDQTKGMVWTYRYDADNRVVEGSASGGPVEEVDRQLWRYDTAGNVAQYQSFKSQTIAVSRVDTVYWDAQAQPQTISNTYKYDSNGNALPAETETTHSYYDMTRRVTRTETMIGSSSTPALTYVYAYTADGRQDTVTASGSATGTTTYTYDANRAIRSVDLGQRSGMDHAETKSFVADNEGHIFSQYHDTGLPGNNDNATAGNLLSETTRYYYANGNAVGETVTQVREGGLFPDNITTRNTLDTGAYSLVKTIDGANTNVSPAMYAVRAGDTLQSIADLFYGNASLWYLIADANGLSGSAPLVIGASLRIPNAVQTSAQTAEGHVVYNEQALIGSTNPNLKIPPPKKPNACAMVALIVAAVVLAIVGAAVTAGVGGAAIGALGVSAATATSAAGALTTATAAGIAISVGTYAAVGAAVGAVASVARQGFASELGLQDHIDRDQVGYDALAGAFSGAAQAVGASAKALATAEKLNDLGTGVASLAGAGLRFTGAAVSQLGQKGKDGTRGHITSWTSLATSGIYGGLQALGGAAAGFEAADKIEAGTSALSKIVDAAGTLTTFISPWAQLAEIYQRHQDDPDHSPELKAADIAGAYADNIGQAFITAAGLGNRSLGAKKVFGETLAERLGEGSVRVLARLALAQTLPGRTAADREARNNFIYRAIGQEVGQFIGNYAAEAVSKAFAPSPKPKTSVVPASARVYAPIFLGAGGRTPPANSQTPYASNLYAENGSFVRDENGNVLGEQFLPPIQRDANVDFSDDPDVISVDRGRRPRVLPDVQPLSTPKADAILADSATDDATFMSLIDELAADYETGIEVISDFFADDARTGLAAMGIHPPRAEDQNLYSVPLSELNATMESTPQMQMANAVVGGLENIANSAAEYAANVLTPYDYVISQPIDYAYNQITGRTLGPDWYITPAYKAMAAGAPLKEVLPTIPFGSTIGNLHDQMAEIGLASVYASNPDLQQYVDEDAIWMTGGPLVKLSFRPDDAGNALAKKVAFFNRDGVVKGPDGVLYNQKTNQPYVDSKGEPTSPWRNIDGSFPKNQFTHLNALSITQNLWKLDYGAQIADPLVNIGSGGDFLRLGELRFEAIGLANVRLRTLTTGDPRKDGYFNWPLGRKGYGPGAITDTPFLDAWVAANLVYGEGRFATGGHNFGLLNDWAVQWNISTGLFALQETGWRTRAGQTPPKREGILNNRYAQTPTVMAAFTPIKFHADVKSPKIGWEKYATVAAAGTIDLNLWDRGRMGGLGFASTKLPGMRPGTLKPYAEWGGASASNVFSRKSLISVDLKVNLPNIWRDISEWTGIHVYPNSGPHVN